MPKARACKRLGHRPEVRVRMEGARRWTDETQSSVLAVRDPFNRKTRPYASLPPYLAGEDHGDLLDVEAVRELLRAGLHVGLPTKRPSRLDHRPAWSGLGG